MATSLMFEKLEINIQEQCKEVNIYTIKDPIK